MAEAKDTGLLETIRDLKSREPFLPFAIVLNSGDRYLIESSANFVEMKSEFFYAYPGSDKFVFIRMGQISAVERPAGAGPSRKRMKS